MKLENNKIILKRLTMRHVDSFFKTFNSKFMTRYLSIPYPLTQTWTKRYIKLAMDKYEKGTKYTWGIFRAGTETFMGVAVVKNVDLENRCGEIGYAIHPKFWKKGFTSITAHMLLGYCFASLELNRIEIRVDIENTKSINFAEKLEARREGQIRKILFHDGAFHDLFLYSVLQEEYLKRFPLLNKKSAHISG